MYSFAIILKNGMTQNEVNKIMKVMKNDINNSKLSTNIFNYWEMIGQKKRLMMFLIRLLIILEI